MTTYGERVITRMHPAAAGLVRAVAARDAKGVEWLLRKRARTLPEKDALMVLLAECADPVKVAEVTGCLVPIPQAAGTVREKTCQACPKTFTRRTRESQEQFAARRYCGRACADTRRAQDVGDPQAQQRRVAARGQRARAGKQAAAEGQAA